ncbi:MAG: hypothetical protein JSV64_04995 [Candidatus Bathyarchaeota archaeon]|nr:MAG: hypothetical protein JSV64_04995 [Candidatus Bathyarchaeota archaeon]
MRKIMLFFVLLAFSLTLIPALVPNDAYGATSTLIQVDRIDRIVTPLYGGLLLVNDTVRISPTAVNAVIRDFSLGFPLSYRSNLQLAIAYGEDPDTLLDVFLDTGIGVIGYYGITVAFPEETQNALYEGQPHVFTVVWLFQDLIESSTKAVNETTEYVFTFDFPVLPSLAQEASICNTTVVLPERTTLNQSGFAFEVIQQDDVHYLGYVRSPLPAFSHTSAEISFSSGDKDLFACFSVEKLEREVGVDTSGRISFSDRFLLESKTAFAISKIRLQLPDDASGISAFDEQGAKLLTNVAVNTSSVYEISLDLLVGQSRSFNLVYDLSVDDSLNQQDSQAYRFDLRIPEELQLMLIDFRLRIVFPEGAIIEAFPDGRFSIHKDVFQETLLLSQPNVTWFEKEVWDFSFSYSPFWASFRPTLWTTAFVVIGSIIAFAWKRPKAPASVSVILVPRETLNEFIETYEEKNRTLSDMEHLKQRAVKGRISRRRYKVRKTTLENQVSGLSKRLADLRKKIVSSGAKYVAVMRQLEVAETQLDNIEADIRRIEIRFKRGEFSAQTYRQLLENDLRRKERARTTIEGVLLRLRE